jgi:hypothetical protein
VRRSGSPLLGQKNPLGQGETDAEAPVLREGVAVKVALRDGVQVPDAESWFDGVARELDEEDGVKNCETVAVVEALVVGLAVEDTPEGVMLLVAVPEGELLKEGGTDPVIEAEGGTEPEEEADIGETVPVAEGNTDALPDGEGGTEGVPESEAGTEGDTLKEREEWRWCYLRSSASE